MYWCNSYGTVYVLAPVKKEKKTKTAADLEREDQDRRRKEIKDILTAMNAETDQFVRDLCTGAHSRPADPDALKDILWNLATRVHSNGALCLLDVRGFAAFMKKTSNYWAMKDEDCAEVANMPVWKQMLIAAASRYDQNRFQHLVGYNAQYIREPAEGVMDWYEFLHQLGFSFSKDEYYDIMAGRSELYTKEKAEGGT